MDTASTYVVVPFISGFFNVLIDRLASDKVRRFLMGRDSTDALLSQLEMLMIKVKVVVNDAEAKQDNNEEIKSWLGNVKDALYDAEDLIDEIHLQDQASIETEGFEQVLDRVTSALESIGAALDPFHEGLDSRIEDLCGRFEGFDQLSGILGLDQTPDILSSRSQTTSSVDESEIFGRDSEREQIFGVLENGVRASQIGEKEIKAPIASGIQVIAVVGMAGIGKTTLAQFVFNDPRANQIFHDKTWIYVPKVFDVLEIGRSMLDLLPQHPHTSRRYPAAYYATQDAYSLELLQRDLRGRIAGRRVLAVLDDVWGENISANWEALLLSFKSAAQGSTIIVTTRNRDIARQLHPILTLNLEELSDDDCWSLIKKHALGDPHATPDTRLEAAGRKIAAKCGGLPLAAKVLGRCLSLTPNPMEWEDIANSRIWESPHGQQEILPALLLSYSYLPPELKRCFAYCSIFPKNFQFDKDELVMLWIAEGFIEKATDDNTRTGYFHHLVAQSFFQESISRKNHFTMHDLIHDLAVYVTGEFGFMLESNIPDDVARTRHFSFVQRKYDTPENFRLTASVRRLRTFLPVRSSASQHRRYLSNDMLQSIVTVFHRLRVLSLRGYNITSIPASIGSLKHLRYLDLSSTLVEELPVCVCSLSNLQTLLLSNCGRLKKLPKGMWKLSHLRCLNIRGTSMLKEMPRGIGKLSELEVLTDFIVGRDGASVEVLGELVHLRGILRISGLENVASEADALAANLRHKAHLDELVLEKTSRASGSNLESQRIFDGLKPHTNMRRLTIDNYEGERFPYWLGDEAYCNLEALHLRQCSNCVRLPPLGQLPSLKHLQIEEFSLLETVGSEFYGSSPVTPFRSLENLKFICFPQWKTWFTGGADGDLFPQLQVLYLWDCPNLNLTLPTNLPSLKILDVQACEMLTGSLPQSPHLCELRLEGCGSLDLRSLAGLTRLTSLTLFCGVPQGLRFIPPSVRSMNATGLKEMEFLSRLPCLQYLDISHCYSASLHLRTADSQKLNYLALSGLWGHEEFRVLPDGDNLGLKSLYDLTIENCIRLVGFSDRGFLAANLTTLSIHDCVSFRLLPNRMRDNLPSLQFLSIIDCPLLESLTEDGLPLHLQTLHIRRCGNLRSLPEILSSCTSLQFLDISTCPKLVSFPSGGLPPNLHKLWIYGCRNLISLPENIRSTLTCLQLLHISRCPILESFPQGSLPPNLEKLRVENCNRLVSHYAEWKLDLLHSLEELVIKGLKNVDLFPARGSLPTSLLVLSIHTFPELRVIDCTELQRIAHLRELHIDNCPSLETLSDGLPLSLCHLTIGESPSMVSLCQVPNGAEGRKIAHVSCVEFR